MADARPAPRTKGPLPALRDGAIRLDQLRSWGAEFDRLDRRRYPAADFVSWIETNLEAEALRRRAERLVG